MKARLAHLFWLAMAIAVAVGPNGSAVAKLDTTAALTQRQSVAAKLDVTAALTQRQSVVAKLFMSACYDTRPRFIVRSAILGG